MAELLQGNDRVQAAQAIDTTRRMRGAVLHFDSSELGNPAVLHDAELLTSATAKLIVSLASINSQQEERERLGDMNARFSEKYGKYEAYRWTEPPSGDRSIEQLDHAAQAYAFSWSETIGFDYRFLNRISLPVQEIIAPTTGVIAPLTMDYYRAMVGREFVAKNVSGDIFDVKPVAVNAITGDTVFPTDAKGASPFANKEKLIVFVDFIETGNTGIMVYDALRSIHRDKTIYSALTLPDLPGNLDYME